MAESFGSKTLVELSRVVFTRMWGMLFIIVVITVGTWLACTKAERVYTSGVTLLAKQPQLRSPTVTEVSPDRSLEVFLRTQQELILSDRVVLRTVMLLGDASLAEQWQKLLAARDQATTKKETFDKMEALLSQVDAAAEEKMNASGEAAEEFRKWVRTFRRGIEIETPGGEQTALTEVFRVSVDHPAPPARARQAATLLAQNYIERYRQVQAGASVQAAKFVEQRVNAMRTESLDQAEKAMDQFVSQKLKTPADLVILEQLSKSGTEAAGQIIRTRFEQEKITLGAKIAELKALQKQIKEQLPEKPPTLEQIDEQQREMEAAQADEAKAQAIATKIADLANNFTLVVPHQLATNAVINDLKTELAKLIVERNKLQVNFQGSFRRLTDVHFQIVRANWEILRELRAEDRAIGTQLAALQAQYDEIDGKLKEEIERLNTVSLLLVQYQKLQHDLTVAREQFVRMENSLIDAQTAEEQLRNAISISIVDDAELPDVKKPTFPITWAYTLIAALAATLMAAAYAFLADYFDHTIRTIDEAERYLGIPVVGSVRKAGRRLVT